MKTIYKEMDVINYLFERNVTIENYNLDIVLALCNIKGSIEEGCNSYLDGKILDVAFFQSEEIESEMVEQALFRYNNKLPFKCLSNNLEKFISNLVNISKKDGFISYLNKEGWYISNNIGVCISN